MANVIVKFGADTSDFESELAIAQRQMQLASGEMKKFATEIARGGAGADTARTALASWSSEMSAARAKVSELSSASEGMGAVMMSAAQTQNIFRLQMLESFHVAKSLFDEIAAGGSPMRALAMEAGRTGEIFAMGGGFGQSLKIIGEKLGTVFTAGRLAMLGVGATALGLAATFLVLKMRAIEMADAVNSAMSAASLQGNFNNAAPGVEQYIKLLKDAADVSMEDAKKIEMAFAPLSDSSGTMNRVLVQMVRPLASAMGVEIPDAASKLAAALADPDKAGKDFLETMHGLTAAQKEEFNQILLTGSASQKQAEILRLLTKLLLDQRAATQDAEVASTGLWDRIKNIGSAVLANKPIWDIYNANLDVVKKRTDDLAMSSRMAVSVLSQLGATAKEVADETAKLTSGDAFSKIAASQSNISVLQRGAVVSGGSGNAAPLSAADRDLMIRTIFGEAGGEPLIGQQAVGNVIRNRLESGAYGSSVSDVVSAPHQFNGSPTDQQYGGQARALAADSEKYAQIGAIVDAIMAGTAKDVTGGAKQFYNPSIASPAWGKPADESLNIGAHRFIGGATGTVDTAGEDRIVEDKKKEIDSEIQLQEARRGGSAVQKEQIAAAERAAAGKRNEIVDAQKLVSADQSDLAEAQKRGASEEKLGALRLKLSQDELALQDKTTAAKKAQLDLDAQNAVKGSKEELNAKLSKADLDLNRYAPDTAQYKAALLQKAQAQDAFDKAAAREGAAVEDEKYNAAKNGTAERIALIKEEEKTGQITHAQAASQELSVEQQRLAIERGHWEKLKQIWGEGTTEYTAAQKKLVEADSNSAKERQKIQLAASQAMTQDYKAAAESVAQTMGSAITGVITGQTKLRDAARSIATQMLQNWITTGLKMVLESNGSVAKTVAGMLSGEALKTAAVTAGVTARTGAESAGNAASAATVIPGILKSITASASETFAGIFGFLSPVMGPAAAGPAAAGEATVMSVAGSVASFAVGAWSLPADMIAQVHKGEMIVPAGATPWAQGVITGAANTPGVNTVHVHHSTNFNVSAMDSRSVQSFFKDHGKTIMRTINEGVRTGSHLGLSKLSQG